MSLPKQASGYGLIRVTEQELQMHLSWKSLAGWAIVAGIALTAPLRAEVVVAEGEQFKPQGTNGWRVTPQDESYASHTYGGMWVTNGGLIGAPADSNGAVATQMVQIPAAGQYRVWSKYQA